VHFHSVPLVMKRVLSVQSHVVHGYVGNRAATFPLQLQGWDVDALNSVQFSNHTGYGVFTGTRTTGEELTNIYENGLKKVGFEYDAILTGYVPSAEAVRAVGKIGQDIKIQFPDAIWLMDPVMGDDGQLYVAQEVIPAYRDILKSGAVTLITPNGFEAETLSGQKIDSLEDIKKVVDILHNEYKVPNVVISSIKFDNQLITVGSTVESGKPRVFYFKYPVVDFHFTGTGDLFSATLVDKFYSHSNVRQTSDAVPLELAVADTLAVMQGILERTRKYAHEAGLQSNVPRGNPEHFKHLELRIIQSQDVLLGKPTSNVPIYYL
jgi:pyridoxine kinase